MNLSALNLLNDLGRKISSVSGDNREGHFLFQRLSVILQHYNAVLLHKSFVQSDGQYDFNFLFLTLGIYSTEGKIIIIEREREKRESFQSHIVTWPYKPALFSIFLSLARCLHCLPVNGQAEYI